MLARKLFAAVLLSQLVACEPVGLIKYDLCIAWSPARVADEVDILQACR